MKGSKWLNLLLAVALAAQAVVMAVTVRRGGSVDGAPVAVSDGIRCKSTIDVIMDRSSIRSYTDRDLTDGQIDTLLRAAMAAPTAGNRQPWAFVVVRDQAVKDSLVTMGRAKSVAKAPVAIVVCGDMSRAYDDEGRDFWVEDASAASENILLAAHSMGLGAVWCGIYPIAKRVDHYRRVLSLPDSIVPLNVISVGYPAVPSRPKDKYRPEAIHIDRW